MTKLPVPSVPNIRNVKYYGNLSKRTRFSCPAVINSVFNDVYFSVNDHYDRWCLFDDCHWATHQLADVITEHTKFYDSSFIAEIFSVFQFNVSIYVLNLEAKIKYGDGYALARLTNFHSVSKFRAMPLPGLIFSNQQINRERIFSKTIIFNSHKLCEYK